MIKLVVGDKTLTFMHVRSVEFLRVLALISDRAVCERPGEIIVYGSQGKIRKCFGLEAGQSEGS